MGLIEQQADVKNRFEYHPPADGTLPLFERNRARYLELALQITEEIPPGRHQSLALTALQESLMWSNAGIACDS